MLFDVQFLNSCRVSVIKQFDIEAETQGEAVLECDFWRPGLWVRVFVKGTYAQKIYRMHEHPTLEKIF
jgi:hypothetical protein